MKKLFILMAITCGLSMGCQPAATKDAAKDTNTAADTGAAGTTADEHAHTDDTDADGTAADDQ